MRLKLAPSILSADFARIVDEIAAVEASGADYLHIDVMDGRFVPNLTWGPKIVKDLRAHSKLIFDCHLMIEQPERYVDQFRAAGADIISFHLEATTQAQRLLSHVRSTGAKAGLAICPQTPVAMVEDLVGDIDLLVVMSVNPGFGGQAFIPHSLEKIRCARDLLTRTDAACAIEVDGGVDLNNVASVADAGADVCVVGSAIFDSSDPSKAAQRFRTILDER